MTAHASIAHLLSHLHQDESSAYLRTADEHEAVAMEANRAVMRLAEGLQAVGQMARIYTDGGSPDQNVVAAAFVLMEETASVISGLACVAEGAWARTAGLRDAAP